MRKLTVVLILVMLVGMAVAQEPVKIKLTVMERLMVGNLIPKETSIAKWKIFNDLKDQLSLTEAEIKILDAKEAPNGGMTGNWDAVPEKEIAFGEVAENHIKDALKQLDAAEKITEQHLPLCEKFKVFED